MNAVQRIKARHNEAAQAEMDALLDALRPAMKRNVQRRREEEALAAYAFPTNEEDSAAEFAGEQPAAEGAVENAPAAEGEDTSADAVSPEEPACAAEEPTCAPEEPVNVGL